MDQVEGKGSRSDPLDPDSDPPKTHISSASKPTISSASKRTHVVKREKVAVNGLPAATGAERGPSLKGGTAHRPPLRRPLSLDVTPQRFRCPQDTTVGDRRVVQPPWRSGAAAAPWPPARSLTSPSLGGAGWMRRSESTCSVNTSLRGARGQMRPATSLPHIAKATPASSRPCLLVALRPLNLDQEKTAFFQADYKYEPQFQYTEPEPRTVLDKYRQGSGLFLQQVLLSLCVGCGYLIICL